MTSGISFLDCFITFALLTPLLSASETVHSDKAPEWLCDGETYGLWYHDLASADQIEHYNSYSLIDWGQPASNLKWVEEFHKISIRSIAYVSFYKAPDITKVEDRRKWEGGSPGVMECKVNPFWQAVDLSKHPEWVLVAEDGSPERPFNNPNYPPGWYQVCTNVAGYAEAALEGVKGIMDMGFDGLFIDNVHPQICFGPESGKHDHVYPDKSNVETFKELLSEVRQIVKSYGEDKVCVLNSGGLRSDYGQYGDALMWESYIFGGAKRRQDWDRIRRAADEWKPYIDSGKAVLALSYVGGKTQEERKQNAFYTYACAKLSGFLWARYSALDGVRIGSPVGYIQVEDGIHYRVYQKGLVAVNPGKEEKSADITVEAGISEYLDLYTNQVLRVRDGKLKIKIPADAGRIYNIP